MSTSTLGLRIAFLDIYARKMKIHSTKKSVQKCFLWLYSPSNGNWKHPSEYQQENR